MRKPTAWLLFYFALLLTIVACLYLKHEGFAFFFCVVLIAVLDKGESK